MIPLNISLDSDPVSLFEVDRAIIFRVISRCAVEILFDLEYDIWVK